jgi:hypothetical protein
MATQMQREAATFATCQNSENPTNASIATAAPEYASAGAH